MTDQLTHVSLFSGIGGIDLAAEAAGFETKAQVEINPSAGKSSPSGSRMLGNSPTSEKLGGGELLEAADGHITVMSGGFPCQPVSLAGHRKGAKDVRWLWPEYLRLIRETKPSWIFAENVAALLSLPEFNGIHADLTAQGYEIGIYILSAADVGAPHQRKRCFILANADGDRLQTPDTVARGPECADAALSTFCGSHQRGLHKNVNADSFAGLQADTAADTEREGRQTWNGFTGFNRSGYALPRWSGYPPVICRVVNGVSVKLDKSRLQALGNAVVPRCAFPFFDCIARIERGGGDIMT